MERGHLLDVRWFPEDETLEDGHFGGTPLADGPSAAETAFANAAALSRTLHKAVAEDTLLRLYALYKQGSIGDISGRRPGPLDVVGRARYDRWACLQGQPREQAMGEYLALVQRLKEADLVVDAA